MNGKENGSHYHRELLGSKSRPLSIYVYIYIYVDISISLSLSLSCNHCSGSSQKGVPTRNSRGACTVIQGSPHPDRAPHNPGFHFMFHVLVYLILRSSFCLMPTYMYICLYEIPYMRLYSMPTRMFGTQFCQAAEQAAELTQKSDELSQKDVWILVE